MPSNVEYEKLLTPAECAAMWHVDPKTITRWAKAGKLTSIRTLGGHRRYRESDVRALLRTPQEESTDPLAAPVHSLWPIQATGPASVVRNRLRDLGIVTIGDLTALDAGGLRGLGLRPPQVDEVRLVLHKKGLALRGDVIGKVA